MEENLQTHFITFILPLAELGSMLQVDKLSFQLTVLEAKSP